jgi:hypothetical protein
MGVDEVAVSGVICECVMHRGRRCGEGGEGVSALRVVGACVGRWACEVQRCCVVGDDVCDWGVGVCVCLVGAAGGMEWCGSGVVWCGVVRSVCCECMVMCSWAGTGAVMWRKLA